MVGCYVRCETVISNPAESGPNIGDAAPRAAGSKEAKMPVSPELVLFAIRSAIRLGRTASMQLEAAIRNRDVAMPSVIAIEVEPTAVLKAALEAAPLTQEQTNRARRLFQRFEQGDAAAEAALWDLGREAGAIAAVDTAQQQRGLVTIRQWAEGANRQQPIARIGLALVEVALDFAATNPSVFGVGGNGERFIRALALAIDEVLPASDQPNVITAESLFGERAIAILAHAVLATLQEHVADNIGEEHLRDISLAVLAPLVDNFKDGQIDRKTLHEFRDLLLGPLAGEALAAVARNQQAFLGSRFGGNKALGAVTNAVFATIADDRDATGQPTWNVARVLDRQVWIKIYGAALDVAIIRPELFGGESDKHGSVFGRDLVRTVAERLKTMAPPFTLSVAATVAADAVTTFSRHTVILFDEQRPWDAVARDSVARVLQSIGDGMRLGLAGGAGGEEILRQVFSEDQVGALVRIVLNQAARTPQMIVGTGARDEVRSLIAGIARAVSDANRNLLAAEDWLEIAAIVAEQAALNPGRLFKIADSGQPADPTEEFAVRAIARLLKGAADDLRARGRTKGSVMFGATLKEAIVETIHIAANNVAAAERNLGTLEALVARINGLQGVGAAGFGREAWLRIFRRYAKAVLLAEDGAAELAKMTDADVKKLIAGEPIGGGA
jgi:hypothetical protein